MGDPTLRDAREFRQSRHVAMAEARAEIHRLQEHHGLTSIEFLSVLAGLQRSILGGLVDYEHEEKIADG